MRGEGVLRNGKTVITTALMAVGVGMLGLFHMPRQEDPRLGDRIGFVIAADPGAEAEDVERRLARPLEDELSAVEDVKKTAVICRSGVTVFTIDLRDQVTDVDKAWGRVQDALDRAARQFPPSASTPWLNRDVFDPESMIYAVTGSEDLKTLREAAQRLKDGFQSVPGVERVIWGGDPGEQIGITVDDQHLSALGLSRAALAAALAGRNSDRPGGYLNRTGQLTPLRTQTSLESLEDIRATALPLPSGRVIPLGRVARVTWEPRTPRSEAFYWNGTEALGVIVIPRKGTDLLSVGRGVRRRLAELRSTVSPLRVEEVTFQPDWTDRRLKDLFTSLATGILGVGLLMVGWMGSRMGLLVALSVPAITLIGLGAYFVGGGVLHQISVAAFLLSIGQFVDNVIVVAEWVQRRIDAGDTRTTAATEALRALAWPLAAATGTAIAAFLPMAVSQGMTADFTVALPLVAVVTLLVSYFYAVFVTPVLSAILLRPGTTRTLGFFQRMGNTLADIVMRRSKWIALGTVAWLLLMGTLFSKVRQRFFPLSDRNEMLLTLELPEGTPWESTRAAAHEVDARLKADPRVTDRALWVGRSAPRFYYNVMDIPRSPHIAQWLVRTTSLTENEAVAERLRLWGEKRFGPGALRPQFLEQGPPIAAPVEIRLFGKDLDAAQTWVENAQTFVRSLPGTRDVRTDAPRALAGLNLPVNDTFLAERGWTRDDVARAASFTSQGWTVGQYRAERDPMPLILRSPEGEKSSLNTLKKATVGTARAKDVPLDALGSFSPRAVRPVVHRRNRERVTTLYADLAPSASVGNVLSQFQGYLEHHPLPTGFRLEYGGQQEGAGEANLAIYKALPLGIGVLLFFLMLEFRSYRKLVILFLTLPLAMAGIVPGLLIGNVPFGFMTILATLSLVGVVINNAMLVMEALDDHRAEGFEVDEAIRRALADRIRPIFLTTAVTVIDMLPLALHRSSLWAPLAWPTISGLISGTFLTLLLIPALYRWFFKKGPRRLGLWAAPLLWAGGAQAMTLEDVMRRAEEAPSVLAARNTTAGSVALRKSMNRLAHAPRVEAAVGATLRDRDLETASPLGALPYGRTRFAEGTVRFVQPLWDPVLSGPALSSARERETADQAQTTAAGWEARLQAARLYLDLLSLRAERRALERSQNNLEALRGETQRLFRIGRALETDTLKVDIALDDLRQETRRLNAQETSDHVHLRQWIPEWTADTPVQPLAGPGPAIPPPTPRPERTALIAETRALKFDAEALRKSAWPRFDATAAWVESGQDLLVQRHWGEGRLSMTWGLWDPARNTRIDAARRRAEGQADRERDVAAALDAERTTLEETLRVETAAVARSGINLERARQNHALEKRRYLNGRGSMVDLLEAEQLMLRWEREMELAPLREAEARLRLLRAAGHLPRWEDGKR